MWAIQNDVYAQFCDECGRIFRLNPLYDRAVYICSPECAKQHRIKRMGRVEAMREYNRKAQRRSRSKNHIEECYTIYRNIFKNQEMNKGRDIHES